jgi:anthranilate phosphoribosyltransferase
MLVELLEKVANGENLSRQEMAQAVGLLIDEQCPEPQIAGLLIGLRVKGETVEELVGAATALKSRAVPLPLTLQPMLDTAGTGGDRSGSLNLSTAAALVAAGAGVTVAKHGNRAASSQCGSADVLEALGIPVDRPPEETARLIVEIGIGFLFAPLYHPATRAVVALRRTLAVRTLFNLLGPLTNPAGVRAQLVGVFHPSKTRIMGEALQAMGVARALVVSSDAGLDEVSPLGTTTVVDLRDGKVTQYQVSPRDFGLEETSLDSIKGGTPDINAAALKAILSGDKHPGRNAVLLNAAAALVAAGRAENFRDGAELAAKTIDGGGALAKLEALRVVRKVEA